MGVRLEFSPEQAEEHLALQLATSDRVRFAFVRQHQYVPGRQFKADIAFPPVRLLIEVQGGIAEGWRTRTDPVTKQKYREKARGAHGSVEGVLRDNERLNLATLHGWAVLRFTPDEVASGAALTFIEGYLKSREDAARVVRAALHPFEVGA